MSLLERDDTVADASEAWQLPPEAAPAEGLPQPRILLQLAWRCWPQLRQRQGLGPHPTVLALVYALSRLEVLQPEDRRQLALLRAQLPKALLALDAPAAQLLDTWRQLPTTAAPTDLAAVLRQAAASPGQDAALSEALRHGADLVADLWRPAPTFPDGELGPEGDLALARALAWGALRGSFIRGVSADAVACAGALRELIAQLSATTEDDATTEDAGSA